MTDRALAELRVNLRGLYRALENILRRVPPRPSVSPVLREIESLEAKISALEALAVRMES